jgi:hypothetical protein
VARHRQPRGKVNKVAFGEPPTPLKHFYLYQGRGGLAVQALTSAATTDGGASERRCPVRRLHRQVHAKSQLVLLDHGTDVFHTAHAVSLSTSTTLAAGAASE